MLEAGMMLSQRYEIIGQVGTGGMSDVYRAMDHSLNRDVAIKVLKKEFATDVSFVAKFRQEAQAAAGLEHPNIVNIYDVGSQDGMYYIVMEYIEGITLKTYISKKGALGYNELLSIAIQVGRGIEAAHNKNIIHRDIKPQNIIISKEGKVKVTDFGIAKAVTSNTINADRMGSVHYVSPEQTRNDFVTFQSDIYSLGIVMYEACTGHLPFDGETTVAVAIQHLQTEITPPSVHVPDVPISVEKIILKATMKKPERRYASIAEMLTDMKKAMVNPHEDFVIIPPPEEINASALTQKEQERIQKQSGMIDDEPELKTFVKEVKKKKQIEDEYEDEYYDDDDDVNPKMDKAITIMGIAAAVIIVVIIIYLIGSFLGFFKFGEFKLFDKKAEEQVEEVATVAVPEVLGRTKDEAKKIIEEAGFAFEVSGEASSDEYDEGKVMGQNPEAKTELEPGATVSVTISNGSGEISIPNVVGQNESDAISALEGSGFKYKKSYEQSNTVPQGQVISQSPDASQMGKKDDTITLVISSGVGTVRVPNLVNKTQEQAASELTAAGLGVGGVSQEYSDSIAAGNIINQSITSGSVVDAGSTVDLVVSLGAEAIYYSFSYTVSPLSDEEDTKVELRDADGSLLETWNISEETTINKSDIATESGTLYYYVGDEQVSSEAVRFTKQ